MALTARRLLPRALAALAWLAPGAARAQLLPPSDGAKPLPPPPPPAQPPALRVPVSGFVWFDLSLRATAFHVGGADGPRATGGAAAGIDTTMLANVGGFETEQRIAAAIGGDSGGVEGEAAYEVLVGARARFGRDHGLFVRAGGALHAFGDDALDLTYSAALAEAGYQVVTPRLAFEAGALGGYGPGGHFATDHVRRDLSDSLLAGGFAWFAARPALVRVEWRRFVPAGAGPIAPLDVVATSACVTPRFLAVCLDLRFFGAGASPSPSPAYVAASYAGLSLGIGGGASGAKEPGGAVLR